MNAARSNAILILHALTGDAHAAGISQETGKPGWWDNSIGPGKAFDTDKYFVICSNVLGGCQGTTGPASINPATGAPYAMTFPGITIPDMVRLQKKLIDHLGIERLLAVSGGSMGGMQTLEWAVAYPDSVAAAIPIATTARHSAQQIAFNEVGRQAIMADPDWNDGNYYGGKPPARGLAVARMVGHITYMSDESMREKFGRRLRDKDKLRLRFLDRFRGGELPALPRRAVRRPLRRQLLPLHHQGHGLLRPGQRARLAGRGARASATARFLVISFTSDWLYPSYQSLEIVNALRSRNRDVAYCELTSNYGHDAFLVDIGEQTEILRGFLASTFKERC